MSASLVGSEMCIRDRGSTLRLVGAGGLAKELAIAAAQVVFEAFLRSVARDPPLRARAVSAAFARAIAELLRSQPAAAGVPAAERAAEELRCGGRGARREAEARGRLRRRS
eukprot:8712186-Alexandrium_andersonii.AAC.1